MEVPQSRKWRTIYHIRLCNSYASAVKVDRAIEHFNFFVSDHKTSLKNLSSHKIICSVPEQIGLTTVMTPPWRDETLTNTLFCSRMPKGPSERLRSSFFLFFLSMNPTTVLGLVWRQPFCRLLSVASYDSSGKRCDSHVNFVFLYGAYWPHKISLQVPRYLSKKVMEVNMKAVCEKYKKCIYLSDIGQILFWGGTICCSM